LLLVNSFLKNAHPLFQSNFTLIVVYRHNANLIELAGLCPSINSTL